MKFYFDICDKLRNNEPFKFSRWGDGEFGCMYGWEGANRDGNKYLPELRQDLIDIIHSEPNYYIGLQPGVMVDVGRGYVPDLREYILHTIFKLRLNLVIGDTLHYASEFGYLHRLIDALKDRNVFMIGAEYFSKLPYKIIVTEGANSYPDNDEIIQRAFEMQQGWNDPVFLVASAMNSNVIIDKLPNDVTAIDIGSVFDPYLGIPRATYQRSMKFEWLW